MKKKILILLTMAFGTIFAQESEPQVIQKYGYLSGGIGPLPLLLPAFGAGYRAQSGHHGVDVSLQVSTVVYLTQLKTNLLYLYYFKPSISSEFYAGLGLSPSWVFGHHALENCTLISPEFVFGKQYRNESNDLRFFQAQVSFPTVALNGNCCDQPRNTVIKFPMVTLSYGLGF